MLLPVYRQAYIGMLANNSAAEFSTKGLDHSAWEAAVTSVAVVSSLMCYEYKSLLLFYIAIVFTVFSVFIRLLSNFMLLRLHSNHPIILSLFSLLPGAMLIYSIMLDRYAERSWKEAL